MSSTKQAHSMRRKAVADALAGAAASLISLWVFYPVDVWKTKIQASPSSSSSSSSSSSFKQQKAASTITTQKKWPDYFAGWKVKTCHTASSSFCYFFLYSWIFSAWKKRRAGGSSRGSSGAHPDVPTRLLLAAISAMINTCITLPLDVLSTRHQNGSTTTTKPVLKKQQTSMISDYSDESEEGYDSDEDEEEKKEDLGDNQKTRVIKSVQLLKEPDTTSPRATASLEKVKSLWKGLVPALLLCSNPSIHYTVFDFVKARLLQRRGASANGGCPQARNLSMMEAFVLGLVAKFAATMVTYPLIRAKMMLMADTSAAPPSSLHPSSQGNPLAGLWKCLVQEYESHGIHGLYRGCRLQLFHSLLKSALLMMARERIARATHRALSTRD